MTDAPLTRTGRDAFERERRMVELGSALPDTAAGVTSGWLGVEKHFSYYRFQHFEGEGLALARQSNDPHFMYGWRKAANGDWREDGYAEGWDAFAERYPQLANRWDPWEGWDERGARLSRIADYDERLRREAARKGER